MSRTSRGSRHSGIWAIRRQTANLNPVARRPADTYISGSQSGTAERVSCGVSAADTADVTDDADSDVDLPDDLLDPSDDEDRKRDPTAASLLDDKVDANAVLRLVVVVLLLLLLLVDCSSSSSSNN